MKGEISVQYNLYEYVHGNAFFLLFFSLRGLFLIRCKFSGVICIIKSIFIKIVLCSIGCPVNHVFTLFKKNTVQYKTIYN